MDQGNRLTPDDAAAAPDDRPGPPEREVPLFRPAPFPAGPPPNPEPASPLPLPEETASELPPGAPEAAATRMPEASSLPLAAAQTAPPVPPVAVPCMAGGGDLGHNRSAGRTLREALRAIGRNWAVLIPLALFALAAVIVPTMTNIATTDDWGYTRSVEELFWNNHLVVYPVVAATAIGQVFWGGLFALIFGMDLGVMRLSTVVAVAIGAVALYAILRMLGVSRNHSVLGTTLYLFNPLSFVLSFTFMTDPHFTSWLLVAVALYAKGLDEAHRRPWVIVLGSIAAGYAFWIRQQGALIPLAVVLYLVATRKVWFDLAGVKRVLQVAAAPAIMLVGYYVWLRWFNDVTAVQESFFAEMRAKGWEGAWHLVRYLTFYELMYLGLILVPILVAIAPGGRWRGWIAGREGGEASGSFRTPLGYWLFLGTTGIVITGLFFVSAQGRKMPYIPQFVGAGGLGAPDVPGGRLRLIEWPEVYQVATILAAIGAIVAGLMICRTIVPEVSPQRAVAGLVAMVGLWQVVGVLPPSFHYLNRGGSLDRYLLPLIPLAIALLLWAIRDVRLFDPVGWVVLAAVAAFSVAGTRDYLVYMDAVWSMARTANAAGVPNEKLDAGSGWDGYHLYTAMLDEGVTKSRAPKGSPWWLYFYAKNSDATYVVTTDPKDYPGYVVVEKTLYDQWLEDDETWVYLVRRKDAPWPPAASPAPPAAQPNAVAPVPTPTPTTAATPAPLPATPVATPAGVTPAPSPVTGPPIPSPAATATTTTTTTTTP